MDNIELEEALRMVRFNLANCRTELRVAQQQVAELQRQIRDLILAFDRLESRDSART